MVSLAVLFNVDKSSIISYCYTLGIFFFFHVLTKERKELDRNFIFFHYYLANAILLFFIFRYQIPDYMGLTGPEGGIGTDDCRYYAQLVHGKDIYYKIHVDVYDLYNFSSFLQITYPFTVHTPLNIVIFNLLGVCFLPYYTKKLIFELFNDEKLASKAEILVLICPFTTYYGCILMRDMLICSLTIASLYYFTKKTYLPIILAIALIIWIRFGSIIYIVIGILLIIRQNMVIEEKKTVRFSLLIITLIALFYYNYDSIQEFSDGKLGDSIIRSTDNFYMEETTFARLLKLPFPINIILSSLFFLVFPIFGWIVIYEDILLMSSVYNTFLNGLFFFYLWPFIFNAIFSWLFYKKKNVHLQLLALWMLSFVIILGTVDLQIRQKTILFPFMCMMAAYGIVKFDYTSKYTSLVFGFLMITYQLTIFINTVI